jgi:tRNA(fMet)-specific endonuclease VapC
MYCLDTNILIFYIKNLNQKLNLQILKFLEKDKICINSITISEFLYYSYKNNATKSLHKRKELLSAFSAFSFDSKSADIFAQTKATLEIRGQKIADTDLQIASICLANNLTLVTNNTKHFENIKGLKIEDWTETS